MSLASGLPSPMHWLNEDTASIFILFLHDVFIILYIKSYSFLNLLIPSSLNVGPRLREFGTYGLINFWVQVAPVEVVRPQTAKSRNFLRHHHFFQNHFMIVVKMKCCLWKLELEIWIDGLICFLGPSSPNWVFRPQTQKSWNFWVYYNFTGFML